MVTMKPKMKDNQVVKNGVLMKMKTEYYQTMMKYLQMEKKETEIQIFYKEQKKKKKMQLMLPEKSKFGKIGTHKINRNKIYLENLS